MFSQPAYPGDCCSEINVWHTTQTVGTWKLIVARLWLVESQFVGVKANVLPSNWTCLTSIFQRTNSGQTSQLSTNYTVMQHCRIAVDTLFSLGSQALLGSAVHTYAHSGIITIKPSIILLWNHSIEFTLYYYVSRAFSLFERFCKWRQNSFE